MKLSEQTLGICAAGHRTASVFGSFVGVMLLTCVAATPAGAADTADESRSINRKVIDLIGSSKLDEASALAKNGIALCEDAGPVRVFCLGQFNKSLGNIAYIQKRYLDALDYYEKSLRVREAGLGHDHLLVARSRLRIGRTDLALRRHDEAEAILKSAIAIFEKLTPVERELGVALNELEKLYMTSGRLDEAVVAGRRALETYTLIEGPDGQLASIGKRNLSAGLLSLGQFKYKQEDYTTAEQALREGIQLFGSPTAGGGSALTAALLTLGKIYDLSSRYAEAEAVELRALEYSERFGGYADPLLPDILSSLAAHFQQAHRPNDAIEYARRAVSVLDERKQENSTLGFTQVWLGRAASDLGKYSEADAAFARAKGVLDRVLREDDPQRASVRIDIAVLQLNHEQFEEAEQEYRAALAMVEKFAYRNSTWHSTILAGLALVCRDTARFHDAIDDSSR